MAIFVGRTALIDEVSQERSKAAVREVCRQPRKRVELTGLQVQYSGCRLKIARPGGNSNAILSPVLS